MITETLALSANVLDCGMDAIAVAARASLFAAYKAGVVDGLFVGIGLTLTTRAARDVWFKVRAYAASQPRGHTLPHTVR